MGASTDAALTEDQVQLVFDKTSGRDRLMWRILFLTGIRLSEMLALKKADLVPLGLHIDARTTVRVRTRKPGRTGTCRFLNRYAVKSRNGSRSLRAT